jgi:hypothetical protein
MSTLSLASPSLVESRLVQFFKSAHQGSRALSISAWAMVLAFAICSLLQWLDPREFNGINLWVKPGKFYISMAVHFFTVAWALSLADVKNRASRVTLWMIAALVFCAWTEHAYITYRAAMGEASHFNVGTPLNAALYSTMAVLAIMLVIAPAVIGITLWRKERGNLWAFSVGIGFSIAAVLSIVVGMTLGGNSSHWIGGDLTDATGLPIFKWSTTGGDLRVSHFIALHAAQAIPFAALSGKKTVVLGAAGVVTLLAVLTFLQALSGVPFLRA